MATYYVREPQAVIRKQDERLIVTRDDKTIATIPLHQLDQLVLIGNVQLTSAVVAALLQREVDTVFMTSSGRVLGRWLANESGYAELRLRQLQAMSDAQFALRLAKAIVVGKLRNQRDLLLSATVRSRPRASAADEEAQPPLRSPLRRALQAPAGAAPVARAAEGIAQMAEAARAADNADSLRGFEGKAGAYYWPAFRALLKDDMGFQQRRYHPSPDPINALLSLGYALLQKDMTAAVRVVGMDAYLGCFHTVQYGRPSLVLDLMEEFRPLVVDRLVLQLVNQGRIARRDFVQEPTDQKPVVVTEAALKRVIAAYESHVTSTVRYPLSGEQTTWRRCFELQARQLARVVKGEATDYAPMRDPRSET
ncbi:MAG: CRISPR-associated endonuclease Cas1 [Anaerolineae bacterium]|nr:CRISPR-associated endonuclease Cas1 [Candidatus Roseilinea sp.]MDW8449261.1 CRISPR-associated endonuclease Cas1 [Anaerolineae bacterium]